MPMRAPAGHAFPRRAHDPSELLLPGLPDLRARVGRRRANARCAGRHRGRGDPAAVPVVQRRARSARLSVAEPPRHPALVRRLLQHRDRQHRPRSEAFVPRHRAHLPRRTVRAGRGLRTPARTGQHEARVRQGDDECVERAAFHRAHRRARAPRPPRRQLAAQPVLPPGQCRARRRAARVEPRGARAGAPGGRARSGRRRRDAPIERCALARLASAALLLLCIGSPGEPAAAAAFRAPEAPDSARFSLIPPPTPPLYAPYVADPRRPNFSFQWMSFSATNIADSGERRYGAKFGGLFTRAESRARTGERGWQLAVEGGFIAQFDRTRGEDVIGWDGIYGLIATWRPSRAFAYRAGLHHVSAHVGDEYAERTGRQRIRYTRGELLAGVRASPGERWHTYAEVGWAYDLRNEQLQQPWRAQLGLEYAAPWRGTAAWYAAADLHAS